MIRNTIVIILIITGASIKSFAQTFYSQGSSSFDDVSNWSQTIDGTGANPGTIDFTNGIANYVILDTHTITAASVALNINDFSIEDGGNYSHGSRAITVNGVTGILGSFEYTQNSTSTFMGTLTVESTGIYRVTANVTSVINFHGDIINRGTFNLAFSAQWAIQSPLSIQNQSASNMNFAQLASGLGFINDDLTILDFVGGGAINFFSNVSIDLAAGVIFTNELGDYPATDRFLNMPDLTSSGTATFVNAANAVVHYRRKAVTGTGITYDLSATDNLFVHDISTSYTVLDVAYYHLQFDNGGANINTLQNDLMVNGDLTIGSGSILDAAGFDIDILGNWSNSRGLSGFVNGATVAFNGTSTNPQVITGNTDFTDLIINNTGSTNEVTLNGNASVSNTLTMSSGILSVTDGNLLTFGTTATSTGTYTNTLMVEVSSSGAVRKYFDADGSFTYPVGTSGIYTPSVITLSTGTSYDGTTGTRYIDVTPIATEEPNVTTSGSALTKYWTLNAVNLSSINATMAFEYDDSEASAGDESIYQSAYYNGSTWDITSGVSPLTNSISIDAIGAASINGNYTAGELEAFFDSPFIVTNTNDTGTGSLRWAIDNANLIDDTNTISFNIPDTDANYLNDGAQETWTIAPVTDLPNITEAAVLDGTTQPGTGNFNLVLDGQTLRSIGLALRNSNIEVYGMYIEQFTTGIYMAITIDGLIIGAPDKGNTIVNNDTGIYCLSADDCTIQGNFVGTDENGTLAMGNVRGLRFSTGANNQLIGGNNANERNVISGNTSGITTNASNTYQIIGNYIGTDPTGQIAVPNGTGISLGTTSNSLVQNNVISGNTGSGIHLNQSDNNTFYGNKIGLGSDDSSLPNGDGITTQGNPSSANGNQIGGLSTGEANTIANNMGAAVSITSPVDDDNQIIGNSIYCNGTGIALNSTGNNDIQPPSITGVTTGIVSGTGVSGETIHVYRDNDCTPAQGKDYLGTDLVAIDGTWSVISGFTIAPVTDVITATATSTVDGTSEFVSVLATPEISVYEGLDNTGTEITNAQSELINLGVVVQGNSIVQTFAIENTGSRVLNLGAISVSETEYSVASTTASVAMGTTETFTITFNGTNPGTLDATVTINSDDTDEGTFTFPITVEVIAPEINVYNGNSNTSPNLTDEQTAIVDFGNAIQFSDITRTFAIENIGASPLTIDALTVDGAGFGVVSAITVVAVGATESFTITLSGNTAGVFSSLVTITSDDLDENPFTFPITGTIIAPEINVYNGDSNTSPSLTNGQAVAVDFGSGIQASDLTRTFAIENIGTSTLNIAGISSSSPDYSVASAISSLESGMIANFTITLSGSTTGIFTTTITITSDDIDEPTFTFPIIGIITLAEIDVFVGVDNTGIPLTDSQTTAIDFGSTLQTNDVTQTFAIVNTGSSPLNISDISSSNASYTVNSSLSNVAAGSTETFTITLSGTSIGEFDGIITISSDDPDESEFTFPITGTVVAPELSLFTGTENTGDPITEDGVISLGTDLSDEVTQSFYIQNTGTSDLIISDITSSNSAFEIIAELPITIASGEGVTFEIQLVGSNIGVINSTISIVSNQSTLSFEITGEVNDSGSPPLNVYNIVTPNGDGSHDILKIENIEFYPDNEVFIFTRSGDKVFETSRYDNSQRVFSGSSNVGGIKRLSNGTYYYMIDDGVRKKKNTGFFILNN